ncbi:U3 small nucleolar RNA-associated protein 13 [Nematocida ausubeli]|nr:U3 small nucleolar RNA-associated protein 13 [Nematocida ausubeli]
MQSVSEAIKIQPVYNTQGICMIDGVLYTGYENVLFGSNGQNSVVLQLELESEIVKIFQVYNKILISTITGKVYLYNPEEKEARPACVFSNMVIKSIDLDGEAILIGTADGLVILSDINGYGVTMTKKLEGTATAVRFVQMKGAKRKYTTSNKLMVAGDVMGTITMYTTAGDVVYREANCHSGNVVFIGELGDRILSCGMDGFIIEHSIGEETIVRNISGAMQDGISACAVYNNRMILCGKDMFVTLSENLKIISKKAMDIPSIESFDIFGEYCVITTEEHDILVASIVEDELVVEKVIVGNNDEITDLLVLDSIVVVSTNSRYIRTISKSDIERESANEKADHKVFSGELVKSQNEEYVLSMCGTNKTFYTGSKDGVISQFSVVSGNIRDSVKLVHSISVEAPITAMCIYQDTLITGTEQGIISGWKVSSNLEQIFTAAASTTEITGIVVNNKKIHCTSKNKEIKVINMSGGVDSAVSGHKKGLWSISEHSQMLLTGSSDKTARLWKGDINSTLQHNTSVVRTLLTERAITATSDGVVRIWNITNYKELGALRITEAKDERIWAIKRYRDTLYIVSAGPAIVIIKDNTLEVEKMKEQTQKEEYVAKQHALIFMKKGEYVQAAVEYYKLNLEKDLRSTLRKIDESMDISLLMDALLLDVPKFVKYIVKWAKSPPLFTITQRILKDAIEKRTVIPRKEAEDLSQTLARTAELFNAAY